MPASPFTPVADNLPTTLPVFPLENTVILPQADLQLNVFENRYLNMVNDALAEHHLIGVVQPEPDSAGTPVPLYHTGCAGRITAFRETLDGRILITLTGVCRFDILEEFASTRGYRVVVPDWQRFYHDLEQGLGYRLKKRNQLLLLLRRYFQAKRLATDWDALERLPDLQLLHVMSVLLPLKREEKQSIVEAVHLGERAQALAAALEFGLQDDSTQTQH